MIMYWLIEAGAERTKFVDEISKFIFLTQKCRILLSSHFTPSLLKRTCVTCSYDIYYYFNIIHNKIFTHWDRQTDIYVFNISIIWTDSGILLIGPLVKLQWNLKRIQGDAFENVVYEMTAILSRPQMC